MLDPGNTLPTRKAISLTIYQRTNISEPRYIHEGTVEIVPR